MSSRPLRYQPEANFVGGYRCDATDVDLLGDKQATDKSGSISQSDKAAADHCKLGSNNSQSLE
jgi:hypothetical protein